MSFANADQIGGQQPMGLPEVPEQQAPVQAPQQQAPTGVQVPVTAPAQAQAQVAQVLPPPVALGQQQVVAGHEAVQQATDALPGHPAQPEPREVTIHHPQGYDVKIPRSMLPAAIPAGMTLAELAQQVEAKVARGAELIWDLQHTNFQDRYKATPQNVTDVMWYLQVTAEHKTGQHWEEGAISIEDPDGSIRAFLDSASEQPPLPAPPEALERDHMDPHTALAYQRDSTHVAAFQGQTNGFPRGLDLYGGAADMNHCLPNGRQTLLYQTMGTHATAKGPGMPCNMLLLKMEDYGCFMARNQLPERGPVRLENQHDSAAFWGHVKTTISSFWRRLTGHNSGAGTFKERINPQMEKAYNKLASWHLFGKTLSSEVREILQQNHPADNANGVRIMSANITRAIDYVRANGNDSGQLRMLLDFKGKFLNDPMLDHQEVRIGNEVVLTRHELEGNALPTSVGHVAKAVTDGHFSSQEMCKMVRDELISGFDTQGGDGKESRHNGLSIGYTKDMVDRPGNIYIDNQFIDHGAGGQQRIQQMRQLFTDERGHFDREGCLFASRLLNQFLPGCLQQAMESPNGKGPWHNSLLSYSFQDGAPAYSISRDPLTRQIQISFDRHCPINFIENHAPGGQTYNYMENPAAQPVMHQHMELLLPPEPRSPQDIQVIAVAAQLESHD